ncbi:SDR family NAD(P)-dependent oxidoreductase [Nesterenkonia sp. PF2B19]|uniref:SDR family NAD(P)-dependent oxidoreductase n=1 Tax=Nesterenkonia sp. PF2B19 TaxID=1881858 RepID=UPI00191C809C
MSSHTALITGSTAGLGAAFARQLAAQGYDLVLVARDADRLRAQAESMASQYGVRATVLVADLVTDDGVGAVQERLADARNPVHLLVNNAGHGLPTDFLESDLDEERDLLRLHVQTTMELTHTAARAMVRRRGGRIINVASVAGFTPTGTYSAAKAWVINFSKAVHQQMRGRGITVTALCPGLVRTEFHERSGIKVKGAKRWMWLDADDVVREALAANAQGASTCVPSRSYQMLTASLKFVPDSMVRWAMERRVGAPTEGEAIAQLERGPRRDHDAPPSRPPKPSGPWTPTRPPRPRTAAVAARRAPKRPTVPWRWPTRRLRPPRCRGLRCPTPAGGAPAGRAPTGGRRRRREACSSTDGIR